MGDLEFFEGVFALVFEVVFFGFLDRVIGVEERDAVDDDAAEAGAADVDVF